MVIFLQTTMMLVDIIARTTDTIVIIMAYNQGQFEDREGIFEASFELHDSKPKRL